MVLLLCCTNFVFAQAPPQAFVHSINFYDNKCSTENCNTKIEINLYEGTIAATVRVSYDTKKFVVCDFGDFSSTLSTPGVLVKTDVPILQDGITSLTFAGGVIGVGASYTVFNLEVTDEASGTVVIDRPFEKKVRKVVGGPISILSDLIANQTLQSFADAQNVSQDILVIGTLIIDTDYVFTDDAVGNTNSSINMATDAKIIVNEGIKFALNRTAVFGCGRWDQISCEGGSMLVRNSYFRNGKIALNIKNNSYFECFNNQFYNDGIGIQLGEPNVTNNIGVYQNDLVSNRFYGTNRETGILVNPQVENLRIYGYVSLAGGFRSLFQNLGNGIVVNNSNVTVQTTDFDKIRFNGILSNGGDNAKLIVTGIGGIGLDLNSEPCASSYSFSNVAGSCIRSFNTALEVTRYNFESSKNAIRVSSQRNKHTYIHNNSINVNQLGIDVYAGLSSTGDILHNCITKNPQYPFGSAIRMNVANSLKEPSGKWTIQDNTVVMNAGDATIRLGDTDFVEIVENQQIENYYNKTDVEIMGGYSNQVKCNTIGYDNTGSIGIDNNGNSSGRIGCNDIHNPLPLRMQGASANTTVKGNSFYGEDIDVWYINDAVTKEEKHSGNIFAGQHSSGFGAVYEGTNAKFCQFIVDEGANALYGPENFSAPIPDWFTNQFAFNTTFGCAKCTDIPPNPPTDGPDGIDGVIRDGLIDGGVYHNAYQWNLNRQLYQRLALTGNPPASFSAFYAAHNNDEIGKFYALKNKLSNALSYSTMEQNLVTQRLKNRDSLQRLVLKMNSVKVVNYTELMKDETNNTMFEQLNADWKTNNNTIRSIATQKSNQLNAVLDEVVVKNQEIVGTAVYIQNTKKVNAVYYDVLRNPFREELLPAQISTLYAVASQCPLAGGDAVYSARAILNITDRTYNFDDRILCPITSGKQAQKPSVNQVTIFPNPASDYIVVTKELKNIDKEGSLAIIDGLGRTIYTTSLETGQVNVAIDVQHYTAGLYRCVMQCDGSTQIMSFVVQH